MKKVLALILALCMAFALAVPAYAADEEVSGPLVLYSSMTEFDLEALETCFNEVYPDVEIEVVSGSVGEYTSRIAAEADNPQGDVTWGGLCDSDGMTHEALFEKWVSIHNDEAMEGYSTPNGFYSMDHLSTICFCVNTELEEELGLDIRSYQDLLDPALKGKIVISDPNSSSAAWNNLCNIFSVFGVGTDEAWDYIAKLLENMVVVEKSSEVRYPTEGTSAAAYGMAIVQNCPHRAAAEALVNFMTSAEGQSAIAAYEEGTLRLTNANYVVPEGAWLEASADMTWVPRPVNELIERKAELLEHWNELVGQIQG